MRVGQGSGVGGGAGISALVTIIVSPGGRQRSRSDYDE
jgi:hypothetical protein